MARCEECLHYEVCMYVNAKAVECVRVENCKLFKPTADVVPKSEVENIFAEIDSKILAEIDINNGVLVEFEGADEISYRIKGEVAALCKIRDFITELKKKYTDKKECPDCRYFAGCEKAVWVGPCGRYEKVKEAGSGK